MKVLNPTLFAALQHRFKHVEVVNHGHPGRIFRVPTYIGGKPRLNVAATGGEYYKLNCPHCNDTRMRLNITYLFGTVDPVSKQRLFHLLHCFNQDCFDWLAGKEFHDHIMTRYQRRRARSGSVSVSAPAVVQSAIVPDLRKQIYLPRGCTEIHRLDTDHHARSYLEARDYDVDELWRWWRVRYCESDRGCTPGIFERIVIPIFAARPVIAEASDSVSRWPLAGWQARLTYDPGDKKERKYLFASGFNKSQMLYGVHRAANRTGPVALLEGVTDVWRLGQNAVATFGKTMSLAQERLVVAIFRGRPIVVAYDRDADPESHKVRDKLRQARAAIGDTAPVSILRLPPSFKDIGECTRDQARKLVADALRL